MTGRRTVVLQVLSCVLFLIPITSPASATSAAGGLTIRADLTHVDSGRGFTGSELLNRMVSRSRARAARLYGRHSHPYGHPATAVAAPGTVGGIGTEYLIHLAIGTPRPQRVALTLDTGSDLVWTQCASCAVCFDQPSQNFDPSASKTIRNVLCSDPICANSTDSLCPIRDDPCVYLDSYGDGSITGGNVLRDTFTFKGYGGGAAVVPEISFGCGLFNKGIFDTNESGIAGFGRGPQSLPSQLKVGRFSHCFTPMLVDKPKNSPVFLGTPDDLTAHATGPVQSTPLKRNPVIPSINYYYLSLEGITVGSTRLPVTASAFAINEEDGSGGTLIDSGTSFTTFPIAVYEQLRKAFVAQVPLPVDANSSSETGADFLCFSAADAEKVAVPKLVFHLEGADMDLPRENYMPVINGKLLCLIIDSTKDNQTLIGNFQQQNMHIVYDVENSKLLFAPAQCDKL
ncbi:unnamed protein product [Urochloa decumbens]|uniref:Peptidase A1 domain-containing protein n=1 Tax=Urochloa decumbens TaxID=240449 RepID=A0ABC9DXN2_9POAL